MSDFWRDLLEFVTGPDYLACALWATGCYVVLGLLRWLGVRLAWPAAKWTARLPLRGWRWATKRREVTYSDLAFALVEEMNQPGLRLEWVANGIEDMHTPGGLRVRFGSEGVIDLARKTADKEERLLLLLERNGKRDVALVQQTALTARTRATAEQHAAACKAAVEALTAPRREVANPAPSPPDTPTQPKPAEADLIREARALGYGGEPCFKCGKRTVVRSGQRCKCETCGVGYEAVLKTP